MGRMANNHKSWEEKVLPFLRKVDDQILSVLAQNEVTLDSCLRRLHAAFSQDDREDVKDAGTLQQQVAELFKIVRTTESNDLLRELLEWFCQECADVQKYWARADHPLHDFVFSEIGVKFQCESTL